MGTGWEGSGFPAHSAMFLSESLNGERCCPLADWYLSGRNAKRWECLGREAGGPCSERGELPSAPPLLSKPGLLGVAGAAERFRSR